MLARVGMLAPCELDQAPRCHKQGSEPRTDNALGLASLLKNTIQVFFNLAKLRAKLFAARKTTTYVAVLTSASLRCSNPSSQSTDC